ncbi:hypothetical protein Trydic_g13406, partial [Trypoxylus dichotomus]
MYLISGIIEFHDDVLKNFGDPRVEGYFLMGSFWHVLALLTAYLYFATSLGPKLMTNKKP